MLCQLTLLNVECSALAKASCIFKDLTSDECATVVFLPLNIHHLIVLMKMLLLLIYAFV